MSPIIKHGVFNLSTIATKIKFNIYGVQFSAYSFRNTNLVSQIIDDFSWTKAVPKSPIQKNVQITILSPAIHKFNKIQPQLLPYHGLNKRRVNLKTALIHYRKINNRIKIAFIINPQATPHYSDLHKVIFAALNEAWDEMGLIRLHAAAFTEYQKTMIFEAPSGYGKSSTVLKKHLLGEKIWCDECLLIKHNQIFTLPMSISLLQTDRPLFHRLQNFETRIKPLNENKISIKLPLSQEIPIHPTHLKLPQQPFAKFNFIVRATIAVGTIQMIEYRLRLDSFYHLIRIMSLRLKFSFFFLKQMEITYSINNKSRTLREYLNKIIKFLPIKIYTLPHHTLIKILSLYIQSDSNNQNHIHPRNSYVFNRIEPLYSDVDFTIILKQNSFVIRKNYEALFSSIRKFIPLLGELNIYSNEYVDTLLKIGNPIELLRDPYLCKNYSFTIYPEHRFLFINKMLESNYRVLMQNDDSNKNKWNFYLHHAWNQTLSNISPAHILTENLKLVGQDTGSWIEIDQFLQLNTDSDWVNIEALANQKSWWKCLFPNRVCHLELDYNLSHFHQLCLLAAVEWEIWGLATRPTHQNPQQVTNHARRLIDILNKAIQTDQNNAHTRLKRLQEMYMKLLNESIDPSEHSLLG